MLTKDEAASLLSAARRVRERAYAPYSGYRVGAAIMSEDGVIHEGCNVENAAYPEGTCAEAGAIAAMMAAGGNRRIRAVAVIGGKPDNAPEDAPWDLASPCGGCRQKLAEFAPGGAIVLIGSPHDVLLETTVAALLPHAFNLEDG